MDVLTNPLLESKSPVLQISNDVVGYTPEEFLLANSNISKQSLCTLKTLYDYTKQEETELGHAPLILTSAIPHKKRKKKSKTAISVTEAPLKSLIVESFDCEQVWEELQLQNSLIYDHLVTSISKLLAHSKAIFSQAPEKAVIPSRKRVSIPAKYRKSDFIDSEDDVEFEGSEKKRKKAAVQVYAKSIVDDQFFNLAQMTEFLEKVESQMETDNPDEHSDSDDSVDYFDDVDQVESEGEGEDATNLYYDKFFDTPLDSISGSIPTADGKEASDSELKQTESNEDEDDDEDLSEDDNLEGIENPASGFISDDSDSSEDEVTKPDLDFYVPETKVSLNLSSFEKRKKKLEQSITEMEAAALQPKGWQYQGEITAEKRPENSLLIENVSFDHMLRAAPIITAEVTLKLEDIIQQRIKDQAWDDVERKAKPIDNAFEFKKKLIIDSEKSKQSLAQIYEQEYINQKKAEDGQLEIEKEPEDEAGIRKNMKTLFVKLDALSNFHFTPKPPVTDIKIVSNLPTILMEEVAPVNVSDATLLAPREIQAPIKGEMKSLDERNATDKKRERRLKKKKQHLKRIGREERNRLKGLGLRNIKLAENVISQQEKTKNKKGQGVTEENQTSRKELKSSKAFFDKLQDKVETHIKDKLEKSSKKSQSTKKGSQAKKFKL